MSFKFGYFLSLYLYTSGGMPSPMLFYPSVVSFFPLPINFHYPSFRLSLPFIKTAVQFPSSLPTSFCHCSNITQQNFIRYSHNSITSVLKFFRGSSLSMLNILLRFLRLSTKYFQLFLVALSPNATLLSLWVTKWVIHWSPDLVLIYFRPLLVIFWLVSVSHSFLYLSRSCLFAISGIVIFMKFIWTLKIVYGFFSFLNFDSFLSPIALTVHLFYSSFGLVLGLTLKWLWVSWVQELYHFDALHNLA